MKKLLIVVATVAVGFLGYQFYVRKLAGQQQAASALLPVNVLEVTEREYFPHVSFVAKIEPKEKVAILARVTGFLTQRLFAEGDYVKEGQILFEIEKDQFEAALRRAEANVAKAKASEANAVAQYQRAKDLIKTNDISKARLDEREAEASGAEALVRQAESEAELARLNLDYTDIRAPLSGRIGEAYYSVGALISPESGVLANIVSTTPIYAVFSVPENQLLQMRHTFAADQEKATEGVDITFVFADGEVYNHPGSLNFIDIELDQQMNTLKLRASFPNPDNGLIPGQYGRVVIAYKKPQNALLVPQLAVQRDLAGAFVYVVNEKNQIEKRPVNEGVELDGGAVAIEKGLAVGERIVVDNFQKIVPTMFVNPTLVEWQTVVPDQKEVTE
ncbi:MAG: efflux RND transporter periplasmic adaptor subunit [Alphaproteobacteria bacterium]|nr:efflux RND transporter periplasmic adaptor subunit [Alphaproteobacteria bacterium]